MTEEFVTFELAKKLKEKGFRLDCFAYYMPHSDELIYNVKPYKGVTLYSFNSLRKELISSDFIDAPTISQVLKWLREEKDVDLVIYPIFIYKADDRAKEYHCKIYAPQLNKPVPTDEYRNRYESAALDGIKYVIDNLI